MRHFLFVLCVLVSLLVGSRIAHATERENALAAYSSYTTAYSYSNGYYLSMSSAKSSANSAKSNAWSSYMMWSMMHGPNATIETFLNAADDFYDYGVMTDETNGNFYGMEAGTSLANGNNSFNLGEQGTDHNSIYYSSARDYYEMGVTDLGYAQQWYEEGQGNRILSGGKAA